jgi:hypothetical protein
MSKMMSLACLCLLVVFAVGCTQSQSVRSKVIKTKLGIKMELADIDFSVGNQNESVGSVNQTQCSNWPEVKGVNYSQVQEGPRPNAVGKNGLPFDQFLSLEMTCGGNKGKFGWLLNNGELTNTPVLQVNGRTGGQRAMDFIGNVSTGAGIAAAGALIRPSRQSFTGGGNNNSAGANAGANAGAIGVGVGKGGAGGQGGAGIGTAGVYYP